MFRASKNFSMSTAPMLKDEGISFFKNRALIKSPVLDASVPEFLMQDSERNKTISKKFKIKNTGDYDLNSIDVTTDADSKYNVTISDISSS